MKGLSGKVAIVSAASSGIGKAVAQVMASEGCRVHMFSRNEAKIRRAAEEIKGKTGSQVNYSVGDLANPDDVKRVLSEVRAKTGEVDYLVVNFGDPKVAPFMDITEEDWDSSINMIVKSSVLMARDVIPEMVNRMYGRIVFITSMTTKQPLENFAISASLRAAVVSLSKVLSNEFADRGITSNAISQGYFMTPRLESIAQNNSRKFNITVEKAYDAIKQGIPAKRFGNPEEIGHLVAFLCSDEASYITGTNIQIDGGVVRFPF